MCGGGLSLGTFFGRTFSRNVFFEIYFLNKIILCRKQEASKYLTLKELDKVGLRLHGDGLDDDLAAGDHNTTLTRTRTVSVAHQVWVHFHSSQFRNYTEDPMLFKEDNSEKEFVFFCEFTCIKIELTPTL